MKFRWTVIVSIAAHIGLFSLVYLKPSDGLKGSMTYYVDLVNMPGGGDGRPPGGGRGAAAKPAKAATGLNAPAQQGGRVKDLTVASKPVESELRFPDGKKKRDASRKQDKPKPEKEKMVTVVTRKEKGADKSAAALEHAGEQSTEDDPFLRIGVDGGVEGDGQGGAEGDGSGSGLGFGPGGPGGGYNYYYGALQNKIRNAWFNTALTSADGDRIAYVACRIDRRGQVSDVRVYQSSGDKNLDNSGLRAVLRAAPFPPMPSGNPNQYIDVIFEFVGRKR